MKEMRIKSDLTINEKEKDKYASQYLLGFYRKDIPWWPFVVIGVIVAFIIGIATSVNLGFSVFYIPIGIIGIFLAFVIFQRPELGCYILIISVFSSISDILTDRGLPAINRPLIALTIGSVLVNYFMKTGRYNDFPKLTRSEWALLGYFIVIVISIIVVPDKTSAFDVILDITKDMLVGVCIFIILNTQERWETSITVLIVTMTILATMGVYKTITGSEITFFDLARNSLFGQIGEADELRYGGPIGEPNLWGQALVSTLPFIFYKIKNNQSMKNLVMLIGSGALILLAMIYTGSRGAMVALLVIAPLIAIDLKVKPVSFLIVASLFLAIFSFLPKSYQERFESINIFSNSNELEQDDSVIGRTTTMSIGLAMFKENPVLGVGFGNYRSNYWQYAEKLGLESGATNITDYLDKAQFPHSLYIEILAETGLSGFLTFTLFMSTLFISLYQIKRKFKDFPLYNRWALLIMALFMSIITFLVSGFFLHGVFFRYIWVLIGLAMSAISISNNIQPLPFARQIHYQK